MYRALRKHRHEYVPVHLISANYFHVFGVDAAAGRLLRNGDDSPAVSPVAVMSYGLWKNRFQLDPAILGKPVILNGTAYTVVGVADERFFGERMGNRPDFWVPLSFQPQVLKRESWLNARDVFWLNFMGGLKPGITMRSAQAAMDVRLREFYAAQVGAYPGRNSQKTRSGSSRAEAGRRRHFRAALPLCEAS